MRIAIASDLHVEHHDDRGHAAIAALPAADVLVCAGDLCSSLQLPNALAQLCGRYEHVVHVNGNHEFYGSSVSAVRRLIREISHTLPGLHHLDNSTTEIGGQRFVGTTLWFRRMAGNARLEHNMRDFSSIEDAQRVLYVEHESAVRYLEGTVKSTDVVVTHHLPSYKCVSPRFAGSSLNCFFANALDELIASTTPKLWIHGHTHDVVERRIFSTLVVCNPRGYPGEQTGFREFVVNV